MIFKPSLILIAFLAGAGVILGTYWVGYFNAASEYKRQIAIAKAAFEKRVSEANNAYAGQKVIDDAELARLKKLVDDTPPNPTIAIRKEITGRIGAIR